MYDSKVSDYNIVDFTPFRRDPMKELSEACKERDIRFCFYYSHREDWDHPFAYGNYWDFKTSQQTGYEFEPEKPFTVYLEEKAKPQVKELLTNYGSLGLIWFDRGMYTRKQGIEFIKIIRDLQPGCIVNGRVGNYNLDLIGDYQNLSDNGMPASGVEEFWETPQTLNETWGYSRFDTLWKSPTEVIHRLAEVVSKGGNYLLNIGPKSDGTIPPASVNVLLEVGTWMKENHESIYGTTASPLPFQDWGFCTAKDSTLFLHVLEWPDDQQLIVSGLRNRIMEAYTLTGASTLQVKQNGSNHHISLEKVVPDPHNTVIVLKLDHLPETDPPLLSVSTGDTILLNNMTALTKGNTVKRYNRKGKLFISKWSSPEDQVAWSIDLEHPGTYSVSINYAAPKGSERSRFLLEAGQNNLPIILEETGKAFEYRSFDIGQLTFQQAGKKQIRLRPDEDLTGDQMYFKSIELRPANK
jgi:alpha-L-fucosidase